MGGQRPIRGVLLVGGYVDSGVAHLDTGEHKDFSVQLDVTACVSHQTGGIDSPGLERPGEGSGQSTGGGADDVIEGRRMLGVSARRVAVVLSHRTVRPVVGRLTLRRQVRPTHRTAVALDPDLGHVCQFTHGSPYQPRLPRQQVQRRPP